MEIHAGNTAKLVVDDRRASVGWRGAGGGGGVVEGAVLWRRGGSRGHSWAGREGKASGQAWEVR